MALPAFNEEGDLPPGVYRATLSEVLERFGQGRTLRGAMAGRLDRLYTLMEADAHFGASVFWARKAGALGGEQAMIEHWRVRREGGQRGIVEIVPEGT